MEDLEPKARRVSSPIPLNDLDRPDQSQPGMFSSEVHGRVQCALTKIYREAIGFLFLVYFIFLFLFVFQRTPLYYIYV